MNLIQLRVFDTVMRAGTVTAAARRLHVTQPAVTNHLQALEDYYDIDIAFRAGSSRSHVEMRLVARPGNEPDGQWMTAYASN